MRILGIALVILAGSGIPQSATAEDTAILHLCTDSGMWIFPVEPDSAFLVQETGTYPLPDGQLLVYAPGNCTVKTVPLWWGILPPVVAIVFAFLFREVLLSLFAGLLVGVILIYTGVEKAWWWLPLSLLDRYVVSAMATPSHAAILVFSIGIAGIVQILVHSGFFGYILRMLSRWIRSAFSAQWMILISGLVLFFDDYANSLVVGNVFRNITDRFRVSREKLAYLVDSTSAPIASIALISTWIGVELSYIQKALENNHLLTGFTPYGVFLQSVAYSFYPLFTLGMIFWLLIFRREYGPMLFAERRARQGKPRPESMRPDHETPPQEEVPAPEKTTWWKTLPGMMGIILALLPILVLIGVTFFGLWQTGTPSEASSGWWAFAHRLGSGDSMRALLWGTAASFLVTLVLVRLFARMSFREQLERFLEGGRRLLQPLMILVLAWSMASFLNEVHVEKLFARLFLTWEYSLALYPAGVFLLSALMSFSTGTSWGTMAIMYPLAFAGVNSLLMGTNLPPEVAGNFLAGVSASVLGGAVFGDHCSPLSDTTIISASASGCPVIEHVRTQLPYALTGGVLALIMYLLWGMFAIHPVLLLLLGLLALAGFVRFAGVSLYDYEPL